MLTNRKGFTLIELLVVIAILATLAVTVFVAINPAKRLRDSRDARRKTDVTTILDAIHTYTVDNGSLPTSVSGLTAGTTYEIMNGGTAGTVPATSVCNASNANHGANGDTATNGTPITDLSSVLAELPFDPQADTSLNYTGYTITVSADGTIRIGSCGAEGESISASR